MELSNLLDLYASHPSLKALSEAVKDSSVKRIFAGGLCASAPAMVASALFRNTLLNYLYVLNDAEEAGYFYHDLTQVQGVDRVLFFPSSFRRAIKYGQRDAANEILRTEVLSALRSQKGDPLLIVTYPEALCEKVVSPEKLDDHTLKLSVGERVDLSFVSEVLRSYGFQKVDYVYEPGQYALRGSIVDVFSFASEWPYRIDFFGDEVESIRSFEVETQLSREALQQISIIPELRMQEDALIQFLDFLAPDTVLASKDYLYLCQRVHTVLEETLTLQAQQVAAVELHERIELPALLIDEVQFMERASRLRNIEFGSHPTGTPQARVEFHTHHQPLYHKNFDLVSQSFQDYLKQGYTLHICTDSEKQAVRLRDIFDDRGDAIAFTPVLHTIHEGYVDDTLKRCFFTDHQIFDRFHKYNLRSEKARGGKLALSLKELQEFQIGDYVVHTDHGVARFAGLMRIPNGNGTQEVIKLIYQNDDVVFVSIHSLHKVSKYKGKEGEPPRINKLGTGAWEKMKERTKKKIKDIARDLIKLYAQRKEERGFAFTPDSFLQRELEASFIYEDTPDQLKTTQDVKHDMERIMPMDRLVCGDVGFGKTEIAIRAAFKAVADNKQVAVLVPTTVLALQHFKTFSSRLKEFPCRVDYLSRARTTKQTSEILKALEEGKIDILIGTHRLIGKGVKFKDLGLLVVDEEQKFGVSVKEKLRQLKVNVDTLTLSATPIPRTLQFSLMGARDLSVITTPPPNRYPIQTEVHTFNEELIAEAINFEMSRNGQVFLVNNRIRSIDELATAVRRLVPDARVCVGHGQMEPEKLEKIILDFINHDYDVLIATSIIESGIDIPNVNTIIINNAHNFGLSDLHQLRGRVGRSNRKAFCYLLTRPAELLTPEAKRRLQAIESFSDLGSGIHIAMQDLDIRGAGNLLGSEQSGFIADVGYETYQKILAEAVQELKIDEFADLYAEEQRTTDGTISGEGFVEDCNVESDLELFFTETYIPSSSERMLIYRELDNLKTDEEVTQFRARLEDRFGTIPREGEELMRIVPLRRFARRLGIEKILLRSDRMFLYFVSNPDSPYYQSDAFGKIIAYLQHYTRRCTLKEAGHKRSMNIKDVQSVETALTILQEIQGMNG